MKKLIEMYVNMQTKLQEEKGATMVEYGLMLALIAVVALGAVTLVGTNVSTIFTNIAAQL